MAIVPRRRADGSIVSYQVKVKDPEGKWYECPSFKTKLEAQEHETRLIRLRGKGARRLSDAAKRYTVHEYWEVWSDECRSKVSEGWKISERQMYRDYVRPVIGKEKIIDVDTPMIGTLMRKAAERVGPQTQLHIYTLVNKMFGDAVGYFRMLSESPVNPKFHRPEVPKVERAFLEPAQAFQLLEYVRDHKYLGPPIWLGLLSALRISEIQALRWGRIQWDRNQFLICEIYNSKEKRLQDHPKQEDWALTPMTPMLREYLERRKKGGPEEFVAPGPNGNMLSYNTFIKALPRICKLAGLPPITSHELRHSSSEIWVQAGATQEDIRRLMNHESSATTSRYMHRTDSRLTQLGQRIGSPHLQLVGGTSFPKSFPIGKFQTSASLESEEQVVH